MSEDDCIKIEIVKEIPFFGQGDTLETRLRKVSLRGFPDVKIYEKAQFELVSFTPEDIREKLHTPQPSVYQTALKRVEQLAELFKKQGIDILNLDRAYDFVATSSSGKQTEWTMIPPIVERFRIPKHSEGGFDYTSLVGEKLMEKLRQESLGLNPEITHTPHTSESSMFDLINDGSHRIHYGFMQKGIKVIRVTGMTEGYPYYAVPKPYSSVKIMPEINEEAAKTKTHIVQEPAQKLLYRLFPSGGIKSGEVRPIVKGEKFI